MISSTMSAKERLAKVNELALAMVERAKEAVGKDGKPTVHSLYLMAIAGMWVDTWGAILDDKQIKLTGLMAEYYSVGCRASMQARHANLPEAKKDKAKQIK